MKSYTDLEQSKKLAEILSVGSADIYWSRCTITDFGDDVLKVSYAIEPCNISQFRNTREDVPCWSLAALLSVLPKGVSLLKNSYDETYAIINTDFENEDVKIEWYDNPVDACYKMIIKLNELKML